MKHVKPKAEYINAYNLAKEKWFPFSSHNTIIKHINKGYLKATQLSDKRYMIKISDAKKYAKLEHRWVK